VRGAKGWFLILVIWALVIIFAIGALTDIY
jgi:hypothetical protein